MIFLASLSLKIVDIERWWGFRSLEEVINWVPEEYRGAVGALMEEAYLKCCLPPDDGNSPGMSPEDLLDAKNHALEWKQDNTTALNKVIDESVARLASWDEFLESLRDGPTRVSGAAKALMAAGGEYWVRRIYRWVDRVRNLETVEVLWYVFCNSDDDFGNVALLIDSMQQGDLEAIEDALVMVCEAGIKQRARLCLDLFSEDVDSIFRALQSSKDLVEYAYMHNAIRLGAAFLLEHGESTQDAIRLVKCLPAHIGALQPLLKERVMRLQEKTIAARDPEQLLPFIWLATDIMTEEELKDAKAAWFDLHFAQRSPVVPEVTWQYEERDTWQDLSASASAEVERASLAGNAIVEIMNNRYVVDISTMTQRNTRTGKCRNVRRHHHSPTKPAHWPEFGSTDVTEMRRDEMQRIVDETMHSPIAAFEDSRCCRKLLVEKVIHVGNMSLWNEYTAEQKAMKNRHVEQTVLVRPMSQPPPSCLQFHDCDKNLHELYAFHGTKNATAETIIKTGFDDRVSGGIYGDGLYFTPSSCKALQYTKCDDDGLGTLLLARVCLGDAYTTKAVMNQGIRRPPTRDGAPLSPYDSVIANVGPMEGRGGDEYQYHQELVLFEKRQAYPEYVLRVRLLE